MNTTPSPADSHDDGPEHQGSESARDDAMLDLLLQEALGGPAPPDQTRLILGRLSLEESASRTSRKNAAGKRSSGASKKLSPAIVIIGTAAALLLCVGIGVGVKYRLDRAALANTTEGSSGGTATPGGSGSSDSDTNRPGSAIASGTSTGRPSAPADPTTTPPKTRPRSKPIELAGSPSELAPAFPLTENAESVPSGEQSNTDRERQSVRPRPAPQPITLVSRQLDDRWQSHWKRLGVQPTAERSHEAQQKEFADRLGVAIPAEVIGDVEATRRALQSEANRSVISERLVMAFLGKANDQAAEQLSGVLQRGTGLDQLISGWMLPTSNSPSDSADEGKNSKAANPWLRLLEPANLHEVTVKTASLTAHQDLRCQRCHEVPNAGDKVPTQSDYWSFAAGLSAWKQPSRAKQDVFYDTADGRQRMATKPSPASMQRWARDLVGSRRLAEGIVSNLFAMVHGTSAMTGPFDLSVAGAVAPPPEMLRPLAEDLLASDFDVLRTLSILVSDVASQRSVPDAMTPQGILLANDDQWQNAVASVHAMAARSPFQRPESVQRRLQLARLDAKPNWPDEKGREALLAQPLGSELNADGTPKDRQQRRPNESRSREERLQIAAAGYPMRESMIVPAWLERLPDFDSRLNHVAHLAGRLKLSDAEKELALQAREAGDNEALIYERLWWIIQPRS
ncbi:hypothetical protein [Rhodopirellula halodulae]|uniref:hypothetical protein n=1 Tax=Rhodopirellula halodulae TaxID=2894198 RepID=UPI001E5E05AC|nr:hypothetical protein [Rhodopirellula sp. JC737]MCC9655812.1 hypothetical protein [Rhodopirellula sp. JC737]